MFSLSSTLDQMPQTQDPANNQIHITYDDLGRKIQMNDPDQGIWNYTYYSDGQLKTQTDAKGTTTFHYYDKLARLIRRTDQAQNEWKYDDCPQGIGKLCSMSTQGHQESYRYDTLGRLESTTVTINQEVFVGYVNLLAEFRC